MRARRKLVIANVPLHVAAIASSAAGPMLAVLGVATTSWNLAAAGGVVMMLGKLPWLAVREINPGAALVPADVEAANGELRIDEKLVLPRGEVAQAYVVPRKNLAPLVRVEGKNDRFLPAAEIEMENHEDASALVAELGFAPTQKPVTFETLGRISVMVGMMGCTVAPFLMLLSRHGRFGEMIYGANGHPGIALQLWLLWAGVSMSLLRFTRKVVVSPDGIETRELGLRRRWAFADVAKATFMFGSGTLKTKEGKTLMLRMENAGTALEPGQRSNDPLVERVREAWEAYAGPSKTEGPSEVAKREAPAEVTTLRPNVGGWIAMGAAWAVTIGATIALITRHDKTLLPFALGALILPLVIQLYISFRAPKLVRREKLEVTETGLRIGEQNIDRAELENAYFRAAIGDPKAKSMMLKAMRQPRVVFTGKRRFSTTTLAVEDEAEGRAILDALALDPKKSIATFRVRGGIFANAAANMVLVVMMSQGWNILLRVHGIWRVLGGILMVFAVVNTFWPKKVRIGAEGVLVTSPWRKQYFAFSSIEKVESAEGGLTIVSTSGERIEVRTATANGANPDRDAILGRLRLGLAAARGTHADVHLALERGELTTKEWIVKMRALATSADYRVAAVDSNDLWRVVEDSTAKPDARVAAAAALRVAADEAGKARLRIASDATASPELRAALEAVAAEDDEALVRALEGENALVRGSSNR